jgi:hypothetical protein
MTCRAAKVTRRPDSSATTVRRRAMSSRAEGLNCGGGLGTAGRPRIPGECRRAAELTVSPPTGVFPVTHPSAAGCLRTPSGAVSAGRRVGVTERRLARQVVVRRDGAAHGRRVALLGRLPPGQHGCPNCYVRYRLTCSPRPRRIGPRQSLVPYLRTTPCCGPYVTMRARSSTGVSKSAVLAPWTWPAAPPENWLAADCISFTPRADHRHPPGISNGDGHRRLCRLGTD